MTELLRELEAFLVLDEAAEQKSYYDGIDARENVDATAVNFIRTHHAEIAEAVRDARRYRALKELTLKDWTIAKDASRGGVFQFIGDDLDAAIDAQNSAREVGE